MTGAAAGVVGVDAPLLIVLEDGESVDIVEADLGLFGESTMKVCKKETVGCRVPAHSLGVGIRIATLAQ